MVDCIEKTGRELNLNNQGIVKYLCGIEEERKNLELIIQKQYQERKRIEAEIERLTYKLCLINKSLSMRIKAKNNYDKTIEEIKGHYECLLESSNKLRIVVEKTQKELDDIMNKKTGTCSGPEGEEIKMLYVKPGGDLDPNDCTCTYQPQVPTKEKPVPGILGRGSYKDDVVNVTYQESTQSDTVALELSQPETNEQFSTRPLQEVTIARSHLERESSMALIEKHHISPLETKARQSIDSQLAATVPPARKSVEHDDGKAGTSYKTDKNGVSDQQNSTRTKNMLLSRLRNDNTKCEKVPDRTLEQFPSITTGGLLPKITTPERKISEESRNNKLQKKSIDVLQTESPKRPK